MIRRADKKMSVVSYVYLATKMFIDQTTVELKLNPAGKYATGKKLFFKNQNN